MSIFSFFKKLFGGNTAAAVPSSSSAPAEASDSDLPPVTAKELAEFEQWLEAQALPHIGLTPDAKATPALLSSRLGGPAAARSGEDWPLDKSGAPMLMLAQVNFAQMEALPDFPETGLLQFFIQSDDLFGLDFDDQLASEFKVLWHPDPSVLTQSLPQKIDFKDDYSPFSKAEILERGISLKPRAAEPQRPEWGVYFVGEKMDDIQNRPGGDEALEAIFDAMAYSAHRVGGYPSFTQEDPRAYGQNQDYDRVVLQIGCDEFVMFGDSGECTFFITQADLKARRFDRMLYNWDCC